MWSCDKVDMKKVIYVQILYHLQPSYQSNGEWPTPPPHTNLMIFVSNPANGDVCRTQTTGVGNRESPGSTSILEKIWKYHIQYSSIFNFWIEEVPEICEHLELKVIFMVWSVDHGCFNSCCLSIFQPTHTLKWRSKGIQHPVEDVITTRSSRQRVDSIDSLRYSQSKKQLRFWRLLLLLLFEISWNKGNWQPLWHWTLQIGSIRDAYNGILQYTVNLTF